MASPINMNSPLAPMFQQLEANPKQYEIKVTKNGHDISIVQVKQQTSEKMSFKSLVNKVIEFVKSIFDQKYEKTDASFTAQVLDNLNLLRDNKGELVNEKSLAAKTADKLYKELFPQLAQINDQWESIPLSKAK
jgi:hypothetical protein